MTLEDVSTIVGIASIFIAGANFVVITVARAFWNLTFKTKEKNDEKRFARIDEEIEKLKQNHLEEKGENEAFRHKYKTTVEGLYLLIESKFKDFDKHFADFKEMMSDKIDLAISRNNEKKNNQK